MASVAKDWMLERGGVDERMFDAGRIGPFQIGPRIRPSRFGEIFLAIQDQGTRVMELEFLSGLARSRNDLSEARWMNDLTNLVGLEHRHLSRIVGCGSENGIPYVVRNHRLGRLFSDLLIRADSIDCDAAAGIMFAIAEALDFLSKQGPSAGSCSMGGVDPNDVLLGFDGTVEIVGIGLRWSREATDPITADFEGCCQLATSFGGPIAKTVAPATDLACLTRLIRRAHRDACANARRHVARALRRYFPEEINDSRALFGLEPLQ